MVTRLLEANGIVLGKTNLEELAEGLTTINPVYGPVLNPYNNLYDVGGRATNATCYLNCLAVLKPCKNLHNAGGMVTSWRLLLHLLCCDAVVCAAL